MSRQCVEVNEDGLSCQKGLYHSSTGEYWEHAGGHIFASNETWKTFTTEHFDATKFLSGLPVSHHSEEDCPGEPGCYWERDHRG